MEKAHYDFTLDSIKFYEHVRGEREREGEAHKEEKC
jgi:hypothetical protein